MSTTVPIYGFGSGGAALNFKVVAYATEELLMADTPKDNTIGVVTTNDLTGWYFTIEQPENMAEGEVWFSTGTTSSGKFNALKKNNINVYPLSAKQQVSGALADVKAKIFQNGKWVDWIAHYFVQGEGSKIGDWSALRQTGIGHNDNRVEISNDGIHFIRGRVSWYNLATQSPVVDLTNVSTLHFEYQCNCGSFIFGAGPDKVQTADGLPASVYVTGNSADRTTATVDVTKLTGQNYLIVYSNVDKTGEGWVYNVWGT